MGKYEMTRQNFYRVGKFGDWFIEDIGEPYTPVLHDHTGTMIRFTALTSRTEEDAKKAIDDAESRGRN